MTATTAAGTAVTIRPARRPARWSTDSTDGESPPTVSGPSSGRPRIVNRGAEDGGVTGSPSICSIGVASATRLPYSPIPSEMAPALRGVPVLSLQKIGEPDMPSATPVVSTAGPETLIRIRGPSTGSWTMSITWTLNGEIVVACTTVSPVQSIPACTCESGMIGPPSADALPLLSANAPITAMS